MTNASHTFTRRTLATLAICALLLQATLAPAIAQTQARTTTVNEVKTKTLSSDERIVHVLNRLGYGARPGDVERVRAVGVERYIAAQLESGKLDDRRLEAMLQRFPVLKASTSELLAKYPNMGVLRRRLQREGRLPADLAATRTPNAAADSKAADNKTATPTSNQTAMSNPMPNEMMGDDARRDYRQAMRAYYAENDLLSPQRIMQELQASRILRAAYSERQLQEVMVDFWSNHFNVFAGKGVSRWFLPAFDRDTIRPNALGNFRDLLRATAESSAMLFYLDNFQSVSPNNAGRGNAMRRMGNDNPRRRARMNANREQMRERMGRVQGMNTGEAAATDMEMSGATTQPAAPPRRRRGINENYARELMELHTLGVEGGYTQTDIVNVARAFTGWTINDPRGRMSGMNEDADSRAGSFYFNPRLHDAGEKLVLGRRIPAGSGVEDGLAVIDILARHPSTARFIATKLCRRFVSDTPAPALVERVAATFTRTDGDIKETLRAIFASPEFNSAENFRRKIKTPFELMASAIRALDAETDARPALHATLLRMGEPLYGYQAPTGYPDTAAAWVSTGALLERLNFALALAANRIPGTRVSVERALADMRDKEQVAEALLNRILQGRVSPGTKQTLMKQLAQPVTDTPAAAAATTAEDDDMTDAMMNENPRPRRRPQREIIQAATNMSADEAELRRIIGLIIGTPEFQRQ